MDNLDLEGVSMREMFHNESKESAEAAYQVVRIAVQNALLQRDEQWMARNKDLEERLASETAAKDAAVFKADEMGEKNAELVVQLRDTKGLLEDAEAKRDSAANQLDEYKAEVERLKDHVNDLRKQIAVGAVNAVKVIDTGDVMAAWRAQREREEEERRNAEAAREAAKPAIYDVQWGDNKKSFYIAKLAATDEEIKIPYLTKGSYREVSAEEAPQFRITQEPERVDADLAQPESVEESSELTPPWGYPEEEAEESATDRLAQEQLARTSDTEQTAEVTRAEFEELKKRVASMEVYCLPPQLEPDESVA